MHQSLIIVIFAVTDSTLAEQKKGGITAFIVPTASPGFTVQRVIKLFGHVGEMKPN